MGIFKMHIWRRCRYEDCEFIGQRFGSHTRLEGHGPGLVVRWETPQNYEEAHRLVKILYGPARTHDCAKCGKQGGRKEWSFPSEFTDLGTHAWSPYPHAYEPLCRPCHIRKDVSPESWEEMARAGGLRGAPAREARRASDPEFAARLAETARAHCNNTMMVAVREARRASDPDYAARLSENSRRSGRKGGARAGAIVGKMRVKCSECGMVTTPGALGRHQSSSSHMGKEQLPAQSYGAF
jgi:hypothetical protein